MKTILAPTLLLATILFSYSCKKSGNSSPCRPESFECFYQVNKTIDTNAVSTEAYEDPKRYDYQVADGNSLVFTFKHQYSDCPEIMDDEGSRTVVFEIPRAAKTFSVSEQEACKVIMTNKCFCMNAYPHLISKASITGKKIAFNLWEVEAKLYPDASQTDAVHFRQVFELR